MNKNEVLNIAESKVRQQLIRSLNRTFSDITWRGLQLKGYGQVDIAGFSTEHVYIIEIELKREDPVNNVVKIWRYLVENGSPFLGKDVKFIHAFSSKYLIGGFLTKRKNAEFIGEKMSESIANISYYSIDFDSLNSLVTQIVEIVKKEELH